MSAENLNTFLESLEEDASSNKPLDNVLHLKFKKIGNYLESVRKRIANGGENEGHPVRNAIDFINSGQGVELGQDYSRLVDLIALHQFMKIWSTSYPPEYFKSIEDLIEKILSKVKG